MTRKKIIFVIVEGPSDLTALGLFFNRFFDANSVYVHIVHGDLTTQKGIIRDNIANIVRNYANSTHLKKVILRRLFMSLTWMVHTFLKVR